MPEPEAEVGRWLRHIRTTDCFTSHHHAQHSASSLLVVHATDNTHLVKLLLIRCTRVLLQALLQHLRLCSGDGCVVVRMHNLHGTRPHNCVHSSLRYAKTHPRRHSTRNVPDHVGHKPATAAASPSHGGRAWGSSNGGWRSRTGSPNCNNTKTAANSASLSTGTHSVSLRKLQKLRQQPHSVQGHIVCLYSVKSATNCHKTTCSLMANRFFSWKECPTALWSQACSNTSGQKDANSQRRTAVIRRPSHALYPLLLTLLRVTTVQQRAKAYDSLDQWK